MFPRLRNLLKFTIKKPLASYNLFMYLWRSIGKGVLNKTIDVKVQALLCLNFDVNRFVKYSFSYWEAYVTFIHEYLNRIITPVYIQSEKLLSPFRPVVVERLGNLKEKEYIKN